MQSLSVFSPTTPPFLSWFCKNPFISLKIGVKLYIYISLKIGVKLYIYISLKIGVKLYIYISLKIVVKLYIYLFEDWCKIIYIYFFEDWCKIIYILFYGFIFLSLVGVIYKAVERKMIELNKKLILNNT